MAIILKFYTFIKKKIGLINVLDAKTLKIQKLNPFHLIFFLVIFSSLFFISSILINKGNKEDAANFEEITKTSEFSSLTNFLISKINSPYKEINYSIQNNDTVEKILKRFNIKNEDIRNITVKLKQKKLGDIYSGRKLSLIIKKLNNGSNTVVNLLYPISNTSSVEIRKSQNSYLIKNILQLLRKSCIKNIIKNNCYSSTIESGVEPNIIVEFAIFGLKLIFKEILEKVIGLKFTMKNLKMIIIS